MIGIAFVMAFQTVISAAGQAGQTCPLNRTIFRDSKSGREFVALKVGLNQVYKCAGSWERPFHHPQKRLQEKCGPALGDEVIVGRLNGKPAVAVYTVERAVPCCNWQSYRRLKDAMLSPELHEWLTQSEMPAVRLGDEGYSISADPDRPDNGPLGRGNFVPAKCREP
jgi:hypothetical protein